MIYLDNNATTALDPEVLEAMMPYMTSVYGNASSTQHAMGREAAEAIENSRTAVAESLGCTPGEIFFNSGATEGINTTIKGIYANYQSKGRHIITTQTEHQAVLSVCYELEKLGAEVTYLPVNSQGEISLDELKQAIRPDTILVCIMAANNETGLIYPLSAIAEVVQEAGSLFFCDATQLIGKQDLDLQEIPIDILCMSAHKIHGPKGVGALFVRRKSRPVQIRGLIDGGQQEGGFRAGTYNVAGIVGLGAAIKLYSLEDSQRMLTNRLAFEKAIKEHISDITINCEDLSRLPGTVNVTFKYTRASEIMIHTPDLALSTGSACVTGSRDPSHVLKAMGLEDEDCFSTLRVSLSKFTTDVEIKQAVELLKEGVEQVRKESPLYKMYKEGLLD